MPVIINGASGVIVPPGSIDAPTIRSNDADTGFSFPASGQLGVIVDGVNQATFSSSGVIFNSNVVLSGSSTFPSGFTSNGTTTFASGFVSSGTTTFVSGFVSSGVSVFASGLTSSGTTTFASGFTSNSDITLNGQSDLRLADADSSNWVAFQAPSVVSSNVTWTLPGVDGSNGNFLSTNGAGTLSWTGVTVPVTSVGGQTGVVTYANTWAVGTNATATTNTYLDLSGAFAQTIIPLGTGTAINCSSGNFYTATVSGTPTYTVTGIPSGRTYAFTLEVLHSSGTITWFSGVEWPGSTAPTLTTGKTHLFMFVTDDQGARWRASSLINYTT